MSILIGITRSVFAEAYERYMKGSFYYLVLLSSRRERRRRRSRRRRRVKPKKRSDCQPRKCFPDMRVKWTV
jgi:hypothetical protein